MFLPLIGGTLGVLGLGAAGAAAFSSKVAKEVERRVPADGNFMTLRGRNIHYRDIGHGPAIVMIHGLAGQMRNYAAVIPLLSADHRVILIDRPGCGHSSGTGDDSLSAQAAIVAELIDALSLDRPLVVGHSLGGAVSLQLAVDFPDKIGGLALIAPLTQATQDVPDSFAGLVIPNPRVRRFIANTLAIPMMKLKSEASRSFLFAPEPVDPDFEVTYGGIMLARPNAFYAASTEMQALADAMPALVARYDSIKLPVRILYGVGDKVLDAQLHGAKTATQIAGAHCTMIPGGGHMIPVTQPQKTADFIREARVNL